MPHSPAVYPPRDATTAPAGRLAFIDGLRCAAFLSVFAQHVFIDEIGRLARSTEPVVATAFAAVDRFVRVDGAPGVFGIVLFFVISGYCITLAARRETPARFAIRRTFRIYPLLLVALAAEALLGLHAARPMPDARAFLGSATLLGDFVPVEPRLAGVEWTLRLEILFYAVTWIALAMASRRPAWRDTIPVLPNLLAILALIAALPAFPATMWTRGYVNMFAPFLVLGVAFAAFDARRLGATSLVIAGIACLGAALWTQHAFRPDYARFAGYYVAATGLFAGAWLLRRSVPSVPWVFRLSLLTYATYLFHVFLVGAIDRGIAHAIPATGVVLVGGFTSAKLAAIVLFFAAMALLVARVEQPLIRRSKRLA